MVADDDSEDMKRFWYSWKPGCILRYDEKPYISYLKHEYYKLMEVEKDENFNIPKT